MFGERDLSLNKEGGKIMTAEDMILQEIRKELQKNADEQYRQSIQRFFKEEIKLFGVKTPLVRKISQKYFSAVKDRSKQEIFSLCEKLLETGNCEIRSNRKISQFS